MSDLDDLEEINLCTAKAGIHANKSRAGRKNVRKMTARYQERTPKWIRSLKAYRGNKSRSK